jgi:hypothetical protein
MLDGKSPLEIAQTETGARVVEQILAKIDRGRRHRCAQHLRVCGSVVLVRRTLKRPTRDMSTAHVIWLSFPYEGGRLPLKVD